LRSHETGDKFAYIRPICNGIQETLGLFVGVKVYVLVEQWLDDGVHPAGDACEVQRQRPQFWITRSENEDVFYEFYG